MSLNWTNPGNENEFQRLLISGADINAADETTGNTALILAANEGKIINFWNEYNIKENSSEKGC